MRMASFNVGERDTYGFLDDDALREPSAAFRDLHADLRSVIQADAHEVMFADDGGERYALDAVRFLPLIPHPDKILCVGVNYRPHIEEMGREIPGHPVVFVRFPGSQVGHDEELVRPRVSRQFDFEGELAVIVGKKARHIDRGDALDCVAGFCCFMDGSVRDWQNHTMQFTPGKNFARSGSFGPYLVTRDEIDDLSNVSLTTRVNGEVMQQGRIGDLVFDIPALIEYCSTFTELQPGDVIATGTPGGVGAARTPPRWLRPGDIVEVDISGIGCLSNAVRDEF